MKESSDTTHPEFRPISEFRLKEIRIPCSVLKPYMDQFAKENKNATGWYDNNHECQWMQVLANKIKMAPRTVRRIYEGQMTSTSGGRHKVIYLDHVSLTLADKVICATVGPMAWHNDPELAQYYGPIPVRPYEKNFEQAT